LDPTPDDAPQFIYRPSLIGMPLELRLAPDALEWRAGRRDGRVPYGQIRRVRLSFRPVTLNNYRFLTELWPADGPKLQFASSSAKSLFEQQQFNEPYRDFVVELHRRMAAAGAATSFVAGSPPLIYWPAVALFAAVMLALLILALRALGSGAYGAAGFIALFFAIFLWHGGSFLQRNRPGHYRPEAVPEHVLPR
jgi:lipopolysaccharide export LptBFGC system permease protein LptF